MLGVCLCAGIDHRKGEQETVNTYKEGECAALHTVSASGAEQQSNCPGAGKCVCLGWDVLGNENILPAGHEIGAAELLFAKIEDEAINAQLARLDAIRAEREAAERAEAAKKVLPQKAECCFDDFEKMDIRTATVLAAERVPKTDKLLKLSIDTGIDKRTIVSGIAEYYSPEEMVGKQICILANLQPRTIRGIESRGMILMAKQGDGKMRFITPAEALANGAVVG
ncbi:MAG TPA: methionine--tRNA ligase subunit beta [Rikenellaceae bacterium]|nr:methionine--tRNA ligase subunit beta [Rikenellaceae bacterium]